MENVPAFVGIAFGLTTALALWLFFRAVPGSRRLIGFALGWLLLISVLALNGFFTVTNTLPPRLLLVIGPPLLVIIALFSTGRGRAFLDSLIVEALTLLHVVRIPVELVLLALFLHNAVPRLMTFEGRNWDILAGLTAPLIYYFGIKRGQEGLLLLWNFLALASLLNIVVNALLSAPSRVQQFAFDQPNVALLHFPFVWLPGCVVPLVLLAHLAVIRQLVSKFAFARKSAVAG